MSLVQRSSAAQGWARLFASRTFAAGVAAVGTGCKQHTDTGTSDQYAGTLYARLGGEKGITAVVDDFATNVLNDKNVNFTRTDPRHPKTWDPAADDNAKRLKKHLVQFISKAAGGPQQYDGNPDMVAVHKNMEISDSEWAAAVEDLKAALTKNGVAADDQQALLGVVGPLKDQIVGH
jgi:hemoglobin